MQWVLFGKMMFEELSNNCNFPNLLMAKFLQAFTCIRGRNSG